MLLAVADLLVDHLTEAKDFDAETGRAPRGAAVSGVARPSLSGFFGGFARALFGVRA